MIKVVELANLFVLLIILSCSLFISNSVISFGMCIIIYGIIFFYFARNYKDNIFITGFLISFFTFLLGSEFLSICGIREIKYIYSDEVNRHAYVTISVALVFLYLGYIFTSVFRERKAHVLDDRFNSLKYNNIRKISKICFYVLSIFKLIVTITEVFFVLSFGYSSLFLEYTFTGPSIFLKLAAMSKICFFVFLATMPNKRECRYPILIYFFISLIGLISGERNDFVVTVLLIIMYYVIRNKINSGGKEWFGNKQVLLLLLTTPIILGLLYLITYARVGKTTEEPMNILSGVVDFFYQQGFSINVIKWGKVYESEIPTKFYSLGQLYEFFTDGNFISRFLFDIKTFRGQTVERALEGHRLSYLLTYFRFPWSYSQGYGIGSSFIAEAYHDFGFWGVGFFSCIYGVVLAKMHSFQYQNVWLTACSYVIVSELLMTPRGYSDSFIAEVLSFTNLEVLLMIWILSNFLNRKTKNHK